jgi:hypothetical protein
MTNSFCGVCEGGIPYTLKPHCEKRPFRVIENWLPRYDIEGSRYDDERFLSSSFFDTLSEESSLKEIASKVKCSQLQNII